MWETSRLHQESSGELLRSFSQEGSFCLALVKSGREPGTPCSAADNPPGGRWSSSFRDRHRSTVLFAETDRLGHPQFIAETGTYWSGPLWDHDPRVIPSSEGCPVASGVVPSANPAMPRKDNESACSAEPLGPEPTVSKGLQLQLHFWDRNRFYSDRFAAGFVPFPEPD